MTACKSMDYYHLHGNKYLYYGCYVRQITEKTF